MSSGLITSRAYGDEFPTVIAMLADGSLRAEPLITQNLPLADAMRKGLSRYEMDAAINVRTIIEMSQVDFSVPILEVGNDGKSFGMKITKVETIELRRSTSVHWGTVGWLWVRIHTDQGITGLGETCPASAVERAVVLNDLAPQMIGRDARDIEAIWHDSFKAVQYRGWAGAEIRAISAVDIALWDLLAKSLNVPVYRLLGGRCWDSIPIYNTCYDDYL